MLLSGPAGTGKSRACLEKLNLCALQNPGMQALIVRKELSTLGGSVLRDYEKEVINKLVDVGHVEYYGGSAREAPQYRYKNGSAVRIGGMDKPGKVMSTQYDMIYVNEAIQLHEDDWQALISRLRNGVMSFQQLIADTNPDTPTHWLYRRCLEGKTVFLDTVHEDNPRYYDEDGTLNDYGKNYLAKLDSSSGVFKQRYRYGKWIAAEGLIYEEFKPDVHVIKPFVPPVDWTRYWSVDFGFTHPFVCQFWAEDDDGRLYLYKEIYKTKTLVEDHARMLRKMLDNGEPTPQMIICDYADAEGRATLERALELPTEAAVKKVYEGIQAVQERMKVQADGKPRLFIMENAVIERDPLLEEARRPTCTAEEIPGYVWDKGAKGMIKETPLKVNDDGCDAARYLCAAMALYSEPRVLGYL